MTDIAAWLRTRVPADIDLDRPTMVGLAADLVQEVQFWQPFARHDTETRFYRQLYRDPNVDVWLICWVDGQSTGYHDHDRSSGAVCVCTGTLLEDWFRVEEDGWVRERTTTHEAGGSFDFDAADIHGVRHPGCRHRACFVDPPLLARVVADGPLRARPAGHAPGRRHVRGRAARRCLASGLSRGARELRIRLRGSVRAKIPEGVRVAAAGLFD